MNWKEYRLALLIQVAKIKGNKEILEMKYYIRLLAFFLILSVSSCKIQKANLADSQTNFHNKNCGQFAIKDIVRNEDYNKNIIIQFQNGKDTVLLSNGFNTFLDVYVLKQEEYTGNLYSYNLDSMLDFRFLNKQYSIYYGLKDETCHYEIKSKMSISDD
jgi:hypothetical protein